MSSSFCKFTAHSLPYSLLIHTTDVLVSSLDLLVPAPQESDPVASDTSFLTAVAAIVYLFCLSAQLHNKLLEVVAGTLPGTRFLTGIFIISWHFNVGILLIVSVSNDAQTSANRGKGESVEGRVRGWKTLCVHPFIFFAQC